MKTVTFLKNHVKNKKGTSAILTDDHADYLIKAGVAVPSGTVTDAAKKEKKIVPKKETKVAHPQTISTKKLLLPAKKK